MEDRTRLRHFHHESGLSSHEIVTRTHSCEQPVYNPDFGSSCRNKASNLGHQDDQPYLPQNCRFPSHVRTSENDHPRIFCQHDVIRDEFLSLHHSLYYRMPSRSDLETVIVADLRAYVSLTLSD